VCEYIVMLFLSYGKHFISEMSNYHRGSAPPGRPLAEKKCTQSEYFTISKGVFNFNVLALAVSRILGGSKCILRGPASPRRPHPRVESFFCDQSRYFTISNGIFKFNFLALVDSEIIGGSKFKLGGPAPLNVP